MAPVRSGDVTRSEKSPPPADGSRTEGVLLVDAGGSLVWWSGALQDRLDRAHLRWAPGMSCCDALCSVGGGDGVGCLTRLALATEVPQTRRWRAGIGSRDAVLWARPLRASRGDMVVFEVRFPAVRDTRADAAAQLHVQALGRLSLSVAGRSRDGDWLQQRPGQVFRYLLASRAGPQRSEAIASALWPERGPSAVANVRYCIFKLREQLGDRADPAVSLIVRDASGYGIDPRRLKLDVDVFQHKAAAGVAAHRRGEPGAAESALTEAVALYRGDFLADDPYADWAFTEREYLRSLAGKALAAMAQIALANGRLVTAADHLQRLAQLEPFDSHVHQMLIEICLRRGRRTEALRHYHALRARLQRAFGEQPDFDVAKVAAAIAGPDGKLTGRAQSSSPATLILNAR